MISRNDQEGGQRLGRLGYTGAVCVFLSSRGALAVVGEGMFLLDTAVFRPAVRVCRTGSDRSTGLFWTGEGIPTSRNRSARRKSKLRGAGGFQTGGSLEMHWFRAGKWRNMDRER